MSDGGEATIRKPGQNGGSGISYPYGPNRLDFSPLGSAGSLGGRTQRRVCVGRSPAGGSVSAVQDWSARVFGNTAVGSRASTCSRRSRLGASASHGDGLPAGTRPRSCPDGSNRS